MVSDAFTSPYTPNTDVDREEMLRVIGVASVDDLFLDVPVEHRSPSLGLPEPRSEMELSRYVDGLAAMNNVLFHTFHLHGHRWTIPGPKGNTPAEIQSSVQNQAASQFEHTKSFGPANSFSFTINQASFMSSRFTSEP